MEASALSKLIVVLFIAGTVIFIVGFSTNYWVDNDFSHSGLWRFCNVFLCVDAKAQINIFEDGVCKYLEDYKTVLSSAYTIVL